MKPYSLQVSGVEMSEQQGGTMSRKTHISPMKVPSNAAPYVLSRWGTAGELDMVWMGSFALEMNEVRRAPRRTP